MSLSGASAVALAHEPPTSMASAPKWRSRKKTAPTRSARSVAIANSRSSGVHQRRMSSSNGSISIDGPSTDVVPKGGSGLQSLRDLDGAARRDRAIWVGVEHKRWDEPLRNI